MADAGFTARLREVIDRAGGQNALARASGLSQSGVARLAQGGEPTLSTLKAIAEASGQSLLWLIHGEADLGHLTLDAEQVPILDAIAGAGDGRDNGNPEIVGYLPFSRRLLARLRVKPENARALRSSGDSMEHTIADGALVMIDIGVRDLHDGRIYALRAPDGLRLKRIQRHMDGSVSLVSDNRDLYAPERLSADEAQCIEVVGRAVWTERTL